MHSGAAAMGQSVFGHPWRGADAWNGFGNGFHSGLHGYDNGYSDRYYDDYFGQLNRAPCPHYSPIRHSQWQLKADRELSVKVSMPDVETHDMEARLAEDGSTITVIGTRPLPSRRRACLPAEVQIAPNGRYEVLETTVPVPRSGDAQSARVRRLNEAMIISMPRIPQPAESKPTRNSFANGRAHDTPSLSLPKSIRYDQAKLHEPTSPKAVSARASLPPSTGIHVEDAEFPWPLKSEDASTGWFDNRGDFQSY
jgi:hypothetical protein